MQRVGVLRLELQYSAIALLRFGQTAGPMLLEREREGLFNALRHRYCSTLARRGGPR